MKAHEYNTTIFGLHSRTARRAGELAEGAARKTFEAMLPDMRGMRVLDLGCGTGELCIHAVRQGAAAVTGIDSSERMIDAARRRNADPRSAYLCMNVEDFGFPAEAYDLVISSLTFHYIAAFDAVCDKVFTTLRAGGAFVFSVEHPLFTASGPHEGPRGGKPLHLSADRYFTEGRREEVFRGEKVVRYHRTLTTYLGELLRAGFEITDVAEPQPAEMPGWAGSAGDALLRPGLLVVGARKRAARPGAEPE